MALPFTFLATLLLAAFTAATSVAVRVQEGRAEQALRQWLLWMGLLVLPVHALGWFGLLTRTNLAACSVSLSVATIGLAALGQPAGHFRRVGNAVLQFLRLPWDALRLTLKERSPAFVGVLATTGLLAWTAWLTWLAPHNSWDGLLYHEPMVNYSLQNQGFDVVALRPTPAISQTNSAPRLSSYFGIWFVAFTDRRLVELSPHVFAIGGLLGCYCVLRPFTRSRSDALGYTSALCLVPALALQLRSTYADANFAWLALASTYLVTRKHLHPQDLFTGGLALGMLGAVKHTGLALVPCLGLILLVRAVRSWRNAKQGRAVLGASFLCGVVLVGTLMLPTYVRNFQQFHNPVYPRKLQIPALDIDWPGTFSFDYARGVGSLSDVFSLPKPNKQFVDSRDNGYGNVVPFVALPLGVLGLAWLLWRVLGALRRRHPLPDEARLLNATWPLLLTFALSPSPFWARYNGHAIAIPLWLTAWWLSQGRLRHLQAPVLLIHLGMGLWTLHASEPAWCVPPALAWKLAKLPPAQRAVRHTRLPLHLFGPLGEAREAEIGAGDVVAHTYSSFPARMWNEALSNRVAYVQAAKPGQLLPELDKAGAKWVFVQRHGRHQRELQAACGWQRVPWNSRRGQGPKLAPMTVRRMPTVYRRLPAGAPCDHN